MEYTKLSNGLEMPMLGYGVFQIDDEGAEHCVADALAEGYRLIDTAQSYGNERGVGAAIAASDVPREDIFLVSKVWVTNYGDGTTYDSIKGSLELLGTDYLDLMLLHQPYGDTYGAWRDMERAYEEGLVKAIGVSNFDPIRLIDICAFSKVKPMVNQVETHVFWQQGPAHEVMQKLGVAHMAWGPFAEGKNEFFTNPELAAIGQKHGKGVGQVALRYLMDQGVIVIPKSVRRERMAQNIDVFDFELTDDDRAQITELDGGVSLILDHTNPDTVSWLLDYIKSK